MKLIFCYFWPSVILYLSRRITACAIKRYANRTKKVRKPYSNECDFRTKSVPDVGPADCWHVCGGLHAFVEDGGVEFAVLADDVETHLGHGGIALGIRFAKCYVEGDGVGPLVVEAGGIELE